MSNTKRKPLTGAKSVRSQCRNHRGCPYCRSNRMYRANRLKIKTRDQMKELKGVDKLSGTQY